MLYIYAATRRLFFSFAGHHDARPPMHSIAAVRERWIRCTVHSGASAPADIH